MASAWPEPPSVRSAEKSVGVQDGVEALAFGITEPQPLYISAVPAARLVFGTLLPVPNFSGLVHAHFPQPQASPFLPGA